MNTGRVLASRLWVGRALAVTVANAALALGCKGAPSRTPPSVASASPVEACASIVEPLASFGEELASSSELAKTRAVTYAGLLELVVSFELAAGELAGRLAAAAPASVLDAPLRRARSALARALDFAHVEREAVEQHARSLVPLAEETHEAWRALRAVCNVKKAPPDCGEVRAAVARFDAAETSAEHERAVGALVRLRVATTALARRRDRAVAASKAVQAAMTARAEISARLPTRWAGLQRELSAAVAALASACEGRARAGAELVGAERPDARKLTVLVHVMPPDGVARALKALAVSSEDAEERDFYEARAAGAFGSGFFVVKRTLTGEREAFVVTNRHVVDLGHRAVLALADGTSLGDAEIVYASATYDLAVLRPAASAAVEEGFPFAEAPAKDRESVVATGFPGLVGRPSYQTTKGYVSNESFRFDDGSRTLTYVQHTAPIDPGSSGGPLTNEAGRVLGVNTLKVTGREGVGLAVPSRYVLETLRASALAARHHGSAAHRLSDARLACLGLLAELGAAEPRVLVLEQMMSNRLVGAIGLEAARSLSAEDGFEQLWNTDPVRAMRIATLVSVRAAFGAYGGPSVLETCHDVASTALERVSFRIRLGTFETREVALRREHGLWRLDDFDARAPSAKRSTKELPAAGPPPGGRRAPKRVAPPRRAR